MNLNTLSLVLRLAARSLWAHRVKSAIVGSLMTFGTLLVVSGTALLDSIETAMSRSIIHSLAGHLQVYDAEARDDLSIYGGTAMSDLDYGEITRFDEVKKVAMRVDNVKAVIPMGINVANMTRGSELDLTFGDMRKAYQDNQRETAKALIPRVKRLLEILEADIESRVNVAGGTHKQELEAQLADVRRAQSAQFWAEHSQNPFETLEFLDTKVAPAGGEGRLMYLRYVGTDIPAFTKQFDRFQIVKGAPVPPGERGILINQKFADRRLKILAARLIDRLEKSRMEGVVIADNAELESKARRLKTQTGALSIMLTPDSVNTLVGELSRILATDTREIDELLTAFLDIDDSNLETRHKQFYEIIAPHLDLYPFKVGDVVTIRAWTKSGYSRAANVKVHGTFSFKGLERSDLSGAANLVDMMTFRELYGQMSRAQRSELTEIKSQAKAKTVDRAGAEMALFGSDSTDDESDTDFGGGFSEFDGVRLKRSKRTVDENRFSQKEVDEGLALSTAVLLHDEAKIEQTKTALADALNKAKLKLKVVDWKQASGLIGQLFQLVRAVLFVAIFIIFAVALVIINNSMLMATLERVREIGTMRAIGAQRALVLAMFVTETFLLCALAGGLGVLMSIGLLSYLNSAGIPAANDMMMFMFSGPRLFPNYAVEHLMIGFVIILVVSVLATVWPARVATRVAPIEAMRSSD
ncbi:MAG: ABC transporter permease [Bradymonadia bacterium]